MRGDTSHEALLQDDWKWDGVGYERDFSSNQGEMLKIKPHKLEGDLLTIREGRWDLLIHVLNVDSGDYSWQRVCTYRCFIDAARAVLGNS